MIITKINYRTNIILSHSLSFFHLFLYAKGGPIFTESIITTQKIYNFFLIKMVILKLHYYAIDIIT